MNKLQMFCMQWKIVFKNFQRYWNINFAYFFFQLLLKEGIKDEKVHIKNIFYLVITGKELVITS